MGRNQRQIRRQMRRAPRVDINHASVVKALRDAGASVVSLAGVAGGCPDLLVGFEGITHLIEIKHGKGKLNLIQSAWIRQWKGRKVAVIYTEKQALAAIAAPPKEGKK